MEKTHMQGAANLAGCGVLFSVNYACIFIAAEGMMLHGSI
jgi:hypothetical protein